MTDSALWSGDLVIPQGATEGTRWPFSWTLIEGVPLSMPAGFPTGWSALAHIRATVDAVETLAVLSSADGTLVLDTTQVWVGRQATPGARVTMKVPPVVSSAWTWTDGVFDVELTGPFDRVIRLAQGTIHLDPEVTHV